MGRNARIALAVGIGYLLGRRRKLRSALVLGAAAAAGRLSTDPQALRRLLPSGPRIGQVAGLGKPLADAGKAAASAAVSTGIDAVGDRLHRQADALRPAGVPGGAPEWPERGEERDLEEERDRAERRRGARVRTAPPEDYEREYHDYEEGRPDYAEEQPEEAQQAEPQPEPEARPRKKAAARAAVAGGPRKRTAEEGGETAQQPTRRAGRERPETGGAPVRRRGRRES